MRKSLAGQAPGLAAAGIVLAPLATTGLPFGESLTLRAVMILAITATVGCIAVSTPGWRQRLIEAPRSLRIGILCYACAAAMGTCVALLRSNDPKLIAGQLLSMGLLPMAAACGMALPGSGRRSFSVGLVAAVTVGCWVQLGWWGWSLFQGRLEERLFLPNTISVIGPALLTLLLALTMIEWKGPWYRALAWTATISIVLLILGSAIRALWVLVLPCLALHAVMWQGWSKAIRSRGAAVLASALVIITGVTVLTEWLLNRPRPNLVQESPAAIFFAADQDPESVPTSRPDQSAVLRFPSRRAYTSRPLEVSRPGAYMLEVEGEVRGNGIARLFVIWRDASGQTVDRSAVKLAATPGEISLRRFAVAPRRTQTAVLACVGDRGAGGAWTIRQLSLRHLGRPRLALALQQRLIWANRFSSLFEIATGRASVADPALDFRIAETSRVVDTIHDAPWPWQLIGHGLGATFPLRIHGFDNRGSRIWYGDVNYIHNFYIFLLFKLGLVGTVLVLRALTLWIGHSIRTARATSIPDARAFAAAVTAALVAYCAWSLTSPEILDFRMAPLWGLLLAAMAKDSSDPPESAAADRNRDS